MGVASPTKEQVRVVAEEMGLSLSDSDLESYVALMAPWIEAYNVIDALPAPMPEVKYPRTPGHRPGPDENSLNAWYVKTSLKGADSGKLKGKKIAVKDNVMVAGVPMMNGSPTLEGYVPEIDATIVRRILDAGGEIAGKAHCESLCLSGGSHTNSTGPVHNPHRHGYSAGGSSSGSAALVAAGEVDMAIGGDQGGSIRLPSSFCGAYGLKPTYGLVPYTGIMPIEVFIDHTGPITATVEDNALILEVIAGSDDYDPRQCSVRLHRYTEALGTSCKGIRIGLLKEGFNCENSESDVDQQVKAAANSLAELGATVEEVSIPWHLLGGAVWTPIGVEGLTQTMMWGDGYGLSRSDLYVTSLMDKHRGWRQRPQDLSETTKLFTLLGTYINRRYGSRYYGKAVNIARILRAAYDSVLTEYDLLLMPTTPMKAQPLPSPGASREEIVQKAVEMLPNTAPFNITHHPAMAILCGMSEGLPVSMMLVARHFAEPTIYRVAHAFEQS